MLPTVVKTCPSAENDFNPLNEYQAQTPETFFGGKPVLCYHDAQIKAWVSSEQFKSLHFFSDGSDEDALSPSPPESHALENDGGNHLREEKVEAFVASKYVLIFMNPVCNSVPSSV